MVSKEYLAHLDEVLQLYYENSNLYDKTVYLAELRYSWAYLKSRWPTYRNGFDTYQESIVSNLKEMALACYELLSLLTGKSVEDIISAAADLHERKNKGYSPGEDDAWRNMRECTNFGITATDGCLVRLCDKYNRFHSVYTNPDNDKVGESATDTLMDMASYSLILVCLIEENSVC